jgi:hypothetical protein
LSFWRKQLKTLPVKTIPKDLPIDGLRVFFSKAIANHQKGLPINYFAISVKDSCRIDTALTLFDIADESPEKLDQEMEFFRFMFSKELLKEATLLLKSYPTKYQNLAQSVIRLNQSQSN